MSTENFIYFHPNFRSDFQKKIIYIDFSSGSKITCKDHLTFFRSEWLAHLKMWHSPYKALIDLSCVDLVYHDDDLKKNWDQLFNFLKTVFLKDLAAFPKKNKYLPFPVYATEQEALDALGVRDKRERLSLSDESFRDLILIENRFLQHVVEVSFSSEKTVIFDSLEKIHVFKSKLFNNLRLWHSSWSLLIDCHNIIVLPDMENDFKEIEKFLKGFFLKDILGFSPIKDAPSYPFTTYRSRHAAAGKLENQGLVSGEDAQCRSKKKS